MINQLIMNNTDLLTYVRYNLLSVTHCTVGQEWNYTNMLSSYTRVFLVTKGYAKIWVNGQEIVLREGSLYVIPHFSQCSFLCEETISFYYLTYMQSSIEELSFFQLFSTDNGVIACTHHHDYFKHLIALNPNAAPPTVKSETCHKEYFNSLHNREVLPSTVLRNASFIQLIISDFIASLNIDSRSESCSRIMKAIKYINCHLDDNITVEELAANAKVTPDHFTRNFKEITQRTPIEYINCRRIQNTQLLLDTTTLTCAEIASKCGFRSTNYFTRLFKKITSYTPLVYRNKLMV